MCDSNERRVVPVKHGHAVGLSLHDVASQCILHTRQPDNLTLSYHTGVLPGLLNTYFPPLPPFCPFLLYPFSFPSLSLSFPSSLHPSPPSTVSFPSVVCSLVLMLRPTIWNSRPSFVRTADSFTSFRSQLKTYMFVRHL